MDLTSITPSPSGLQALSHPVRLRMLGLLRTEGPATATTLAPQLGLNTGATSYHLRQLAQHGFVRGRRGPRQRPRPVVAGVHAGHPHGPEPARHRGGSRDARRLPAGGRGDLHRPAAAGRRGAAPAPRALAAREHDERLGAPAHPGPGPRAGGCARRPDRGAGTRNRTNRGPRTSRSSSRRSRSPGGSPPPTRMMHQSRPAVRVADSEAISITGTRVSMIALPWFVLTTTGPATKTGLVALAEMLPTGPAPGARGTGHRPGSARAG